jgi:hypothetical protein
LYWRRIFNVVATDGIIFLTAGYTVDNNPGGAIFELIGADTVMLPEL